jgi:dTMP kinase
MAGSRGKLIVFEGAEGAGKSTQVRLLAKRLATARISCIALREPGGSSVGDAIRDIVLHKEHPIANATEALLFMASRAELTAREIVPSLNDGRVVLLDRFFLSTYAYQIFGRGLPEAETRAANRLATGGLVPDLTLLLDVPAVEGLGRADARGARDRMERADDEFHQRVASAFRQFADPKWQYSHQECGPIKLIDAKGDESAVQDRVVTALVTAFPQLFGALKS